MIESLEFLFSVVVIGFSVGLIGVFLWVFAVMVVNFWQIYCKKKPVGKSCKHISCKYSGDDDLWICNDCGQNFI